ncbi:MAG: hypothetical protein K2Y15_05025 [Burkholderiaceae bacterium]|nr:hypothetical protein [Burkholderiaceae bacterium]
MKCFVVEKNRPFPLDVELIGSVLRFRTGTAVPVQGEGSSPENVIESRGAYAVTNLSNDWREIDLEGLRAHRHFGDHACFMLYDAAAANSEKVHQSIFDAPFALFPATFPSKMTSWEYHATVVQVFPVISVLIPFADSPVSEWAITVNVCHADLVKAESGIELSDRVQRMTGEHFFPRIQFAQAAIEVTPDDQVQVSFELVGQDGLAIADREVDVYLEATAGALSHSRCRTVGGTGLVFFRASDLVAGETAKLKCGFKHFSGTDDLEVRVV